MATLIDGVWISLLLVAASLPFGGPLEPNGQLVVSALGLLVGIVLILGGLTSCPGAIVGGLIIGIGEKIGEIYWGPLIGIGIETKQLRAGLERLGQALDEFGKR